MARGHRNITLLMLGKNPKNKLEDFPNLFLNPKTDKKISPYWINRLSVYPTGSKSNASISLRALRSLTLISVK